MIPPHRSSGKAAGPRGVNLGEPHDVKPSKQLVDQARHEAVKVLYEMPSLKPDFEYENGDRIYNSWPEHPYDRMVFCRCVLHELEARGHRLAPVRYWAVFELIRDERLTAEIPQTGNCPDRPFDLGSDFGELLLRSKPKLWEDWHKIHEGARISCRRRTLPGCQRPRP